MNETTPQYNTLLYSVDESILTLTLNRPEQLNAFTVEMANELVDAFGRANVDDNVRVIVVTGAGKAFCAGMDLSVDGNVFGLNEELTPTQEDMQHRLDDPEILHGVRDTGGRVSLAIYESDKPVIAAINGSAVGVGATITCAMDIRIVSERAKIGFVFNKVGVVPEACSSWFLPRIVGISQALEWTYSADILAPEELLRAGLVKAIVPHDDLLAEAYQIANRIARHSPVSIALTRQMMYRNAAQPHPIEAHRIDSLGMFYTSIGCGKEGVAAFIEKRNAQFSDTTSEDMPEFYPWW